MRAVSLWPDDDLRTCFWWRRGRWWSGFEVEPRGLCVGHPAPPLTVADLAGEHGEPGLVGVGGRQGNLDAGDHLGHAPRDLDQAEADRVELCLAPEGIACCQAA